MSRLRIHWPAAIVLTLAALPFLLGAAYTSCRSLWFQYAAERSNGTVVDTTADGELTVEYLNAEEKLFSTKSGGSDYYKGYRPGDKLTVFYDSRNPEDARIDLWLEHWIVPLLLLFPGSIMLLAMVLISSGLAGSHSKPQWLEDMEKAGKDVARPHERKKNERKKGVSPITKL